MPSPGTAPDQIISQVKGWWCIRESLLRPCKPKIKSEQRTKLCGQVGIPKLNSLHGPLSAVGMQCVCVCHVAFQISHKSSQLTQYLISLSPLYPKA